MINGNLKGKAFERLVAQLFRQDGWHDAITKREARGGDWSYTDDGFDLFATEPFAVSCKSYKGYPPLSKFSEIKCQPHEVPVMICKGNRLPPLAVLTLEDFRKLARAVYFPSESSRVSPSPERGIPLSTPPQ